MNVNQTSADSEYVYTIDEIDSVAEKIVSLLAYSSVVLFEGELGAGKTTLIKAICSRLGVVDTLSSPSFSIVNEYHTSAGDTIFHFDLYRIKTITEAEGFGIDDYIFSDNICLVEWPQQIADYWHGIKTISCKIAIAEKKSRKISIFMT